MEIYLNYALVVAAVIMFGVNFACTDKTRELCGSGLGIVFFQTIIGSGLGAVILFFMNGFRLEFSAISFIIALALALNGLLFTFCAFKALDRINLSLYSLFSMLGGMVLPFIVGIAFFNEALTLAKCVCFAVICISLLLTVEKNSGKNGYIYYLGIFVLNGMGGVLTTIYKKLDGGNVSSTGFTLMSALLAVILAAALLPFFRNDLKNIKRPIFAAIVIGFSGALNRLANLLLVIALAVLPASAQYPMVTGGVMIVSTVIALLSRKKPSKKEILSVMLAFVGILAAVVIPI